MEGWMYDKSIRNLNFDYWFLRENGVPAWTALKMVGLAYSVTAGKVAIKLPREEVGRFY